MRKRTGRAPAAELTRVVVGVRMRSRQRGWRRGYAPMAPRRRREQGSRQPLNSLLPRCWDLRRCRMGGRRAAGARRGGRGRSSSGPMRRARRAPSGRLSGVDAVGPRPGRCSKRGDLHRGARRGGRSDLCRGARRSSARRAQQWRVRRPAYVSFLAARDREEDECVLEANEDSTSHKKRSLGFSSPLFNNYSATSSKCNK
jgi:hypothetical protein